jgi:hypothetical protein
MSLLWVVGPIALGIGVGLAVSGLRRTATATDELLESLRRFHEVSGALDGVRQATDEAVGHLGRIRDR